LDVALDDVVKLVAFYVNDGSVDEDAFLADLRGQLGAASAPLGAASAPAGAASAPVITTVPIPYLAYPGMLVEIDTIAMRGEDGRRMRRQRFPAQERTSALVTEPFSPALRCGDMIYVSGQVSTDAAGTVLDPGALVPQTHTVMASVRTLLAGFGLS